MKVENRAIVLDILEKIETLERRKEDWERCFNYAEKSVDGMCERGGRARLCLDGIDFEMLKAQSISYYEEEIAKLINELEEL